MIRQADPARSTRKPASRVPDRARAKPDAGRPRPTASAANGLVQRVAVDDELAGLLQRSVGQRVLARAPGPLTPAQEKAAVAAAKRFSSNAIRVIQLTVATVSDGKFGPISAQAVAVFQAAIPHAQDGIVDEPTLDAMVVANHTAGADDETLALVESFYGIDVRRDALSVRSDATLVNASAMTTESANLRMITVGPSAFTSGAAVRDAINAQLVAPIAPGAAPGPVPAVLTAKQAKSAVEFNTSKLRDRRSVVAVQSLVGNATTGVWDADTAQRVAALQQAAGGLTVDGKIGQQTMRELGIQLEAAGQRNSLLRLIADFFKLDENGLLDISFDPAIASNASTGSRAIPGPTKIRVGPSGFTQGYEGLVHTVAHEFEHVRQRRVGIQSRDIREFLGERIEILSKGMLEEDMAGLADDAGRALDHFNAMTVAEQRAEWGHFTEIRNKVRQRFRAATAVDQVIHAQVLIDYNAVVRP
jgi:peptidoglycan hydrolase-like protein with peptidoglycan-binding domain